LTAVIARGLRSALGAPALLVWLWLLNLLVALPAAVWMGQTLHESIGPSRAAEALSEGFDAIWFQEWEAGASGLGRTFSPSLVGIGGFLDNLEAWLWGDLFLVQPALIASGSLYLLLWIWLMGGVLDHVIRPPRPFRLSGFLTASCFYFPRVLRLSLISAPLYAALYWAVRRVFPWIATATRDWTAEWQVLAVNLAAALLLLVLLLAVQVLFEYAKILLVAQERRAAVGALASAARFITGRPLRVLGIYLLFGLISAGALFTYASFGPGAGQSTPLGILALLLAGQGMVLARIAVRIMRLGAEAELVRRSTSALASGYRA
jgi:hypothetical protein